MVGLALILWARSRDTVKIDMKKYLLSQQSQDLRGSGDTDAGHGWSSLALPGPDHARGRRPRVEGSLRALGEVPGSGQGRRAYLLSTWLVAWFKASLRMEFSCCRRAS